MKPLLLDDSLPASLARELTARGRPARALADLGLQGATDAEVLERARADGSVLVTTQPLDGFESTVAVVTPRAVAARRDVVHRFAHEMATQRSGSLRRYPR